jgi:hypothetical protein
MVPTAAALLVCFAFLVGLLAGALYARREDAIAHRDRARFAALLEESPAPGVRLDAQTTRAVVAAALLGALASKDGELPIVTIWRAVDLADELLQALAVPYAPSRPVQDGAPAGAS